MGDLQDAASGSSGGNGVLTGGLPVQATMSNVAARSSVLWVHMVAVWVISLYAFWVSLSRSQAGMHAAQHMGFGHLKPRSSAGF